MTVEQIAQKLDLHIVCGGDSLQREVNGRLYCCDLLSIVMGRAPADGVWVTVMANLNTVAVAVLCDLACVVVAEGMAIDETVTARAEQQGVVLLATEKPVYETARAIDRYCNEA